MWSLIDTTDWQKIRQEFRWIRDMEGVPQDPIFHAEGNVDIHTRMVMEALLSLPEFQSLPEQDQNILLASALLHDVEKRSTTVTEEDGHITSRGHAKKGEFTSRNILYKEIETPFLIREAIAKLVRHHGLPLWVFEKDDPVKALIKASLEVNTQYLAMLAKADVLGRTCVDKEDLLYKVELFKELCLENNCYGIPRSFETPHAKFFYLNKENSSPDFVPFDDTKFEVTIMSGIPGSGKDYYIYQHLDDLPVVSLDDIRRELKIKPTDQHGNGQVVQEAKERAKVCMRKHQSFVWNATNTTGQMRDQLIALFTSYGARIKIVYVEVPYLNLLKQNKEREHMVRPSVLDRIIQRLEVPSQTEAHVVEYAINKE